MIRALLKEIEGLGCAVTREGDMLKLHDPRLLTNMHRNRLKESKVDILELLEQEVEARRKGWLVYPYREAYEMRVGKNNIVYIFAEANGTYIVWRGTWRHKAYPIKDKTIIQGVSFAVAFEKANNYVRWFKNY
ncbi:hypothetical protein [Halalkalibacter nanhaiisediminis]|uniref:TubC N-terminal docking domain-containing protein n=1 Tax=Halalkalibacter nanhaiisediminis TaxID=688079 RepID=A0A562QH57_9BACI|nr:hypothetical protein [Halalkalibacter nanhaiisediminis]TWI56102.1 hypothetical protein IQ10_01991 [Halalkalibacter nanhaiisediminis]